MGELQLLVCTKAALFYLFCYVLVRVCRTIVVKLQGFVKWRRRNPEEQAEGDAAHERELGVLLHDWLW